MELVAALGGNYWVLGITIYLCGALLTGLYSTPHLDVRWDKMMVITVILFWWLWAPIGILNGWFRSNER